MAKPLVLFYLRSIRGLNSIGRILEFAFSKYKHEPCLIQPERNLELRFITLTKQTRKLAARFHTVGLKRKDVLAFSAPNCVEYFVVRAACHYAGIIFFGLPVNLSQEDVIYFLNKTSAKAFLYKGRSNLNTEEINSKTNIKYLVNIDSIAYSSIFNKNKDVYYAPHSANPHSLATLNLSSGTTQKTPKIIQLTGRNWVESLYGLLISSDSTMNKKIVFCCTLPLITAGSTTFLPLMLAGATNLIMREDFPLENLVYDIKKYHVNHLYITPSWLIELLEICKQHNEHLLEVEKITTGTESIPPLRLKELIDFFGPKIYVGYGMVEALPPIAMLTPKDYHKLDSAGKPAEGVEIKILDNGRIAVRSKTVCKGYLDGLDENIDCFREGWFHTNDYGHIDKDGYLYILGRKEEILVEEPELIFAREVEDKLYELPFIKRCMAARRNGQIVIFASLRQRLEEQEAKNKISEFYKANLTELPALSEVIIRERLPINPLGKLDRRNLEKMGSE